jgi:hypothetical protein
MKRYNPGKEYITVSDAARKIQKELNLTDNKSYNQIYSHIRQLISSNEIKHEPFRKRMKKIPRTELPKLLDNVKRFLGLDDFITYEKSNVISTDKVVNESNHYSTSNNTNELSNNLVYIKGVLNGEYDSILSKKQKKDLLELLIQNEKK